MKKARVLIITLAVLIMFSLLSVQSLVGVTISITSKGTNESFVRLDGSYTIRCRNDSNDPCTIDANFSDVN